MMLLTASFSFASNGIVVKKIEVIVPPTTTVVVKSETKKIPVCYCSGTSCGCGPTLYDAERAYHMACGC